MASPREREVEMTEEIGKVEADTNENDDASYRPEAHQADGDSPDNHWGAPNSPLTFEEFQYLEHQLDDDYASDVTEDEEGDSFQPSDDYPKDTAADRLATLANLSRRDAADPRARADPNDIRELENWTPNNIIRGFQAIGYRVDHATVRALVRDPHIVINTAPQTVDQATLTSGKRGAYDPDLTYMNRPDAPDHSFTVGQRSEHPTGQVARHGEIFEQNSKTGEWFVRFRLQLPDGRWYETLDPLPVYHPDAPDVEYAKDEKTTRIGGNIKQVLIKHSDPGWWVAKDGNLQLGGRYVRHYPTGETGAETEVVFIARKFDRTTGQYLYQYRFGQSWEAWNQNVQNFDINRHIAKYNRWIGQVLDRADHRYKKRETRQPWKAYELRILREHFREVIERDGLVEAFYKPQWIECIHKINKARDLVNPDGGIRNWNAVTSQGERHVYNLDDPTMGIHEWRQLGKQIGEQIRKHSIPAHVLAQYDRLLKPRDCIPMDDIADKKAGGYNIVATENKRKGLRREDTIKGNPYDKITVTYADGGFSASDRFEGALIRKWFLDPSATEEQQMAEGGEVQLEQAAGGQTRDEGDENEWEDASEDEYNEPQSKRIKR